MMIIHVTSPCGVSHPLRDLILVSSQPAGGCADVLQSFLGSGCSRSLCLGTVASGPEYPQGRWLQLDQNWRLTPASHGDSSLR